MSDQSEQLLNLSFLGEEGQETTQAPGQESGDLLDVSFLGSPQQPTIEEDWGSVLSKTMDNLPERAQLGVNAIIQDMRYQYSQTVDATNDASKLTRRLNANPQDEEARLITENLGINPDSLIGDPRATADAFKQLSERLQSEKIKNDPEIARLVGEANTLQEELKANSPQVDQWSAKGIVSSMLGAGAEMLPSVLATLVTKKPVLGSGIMAGQVYGQKLAEGQEKGLTREEGRDRAVIATLTEFATERIPLGQLIKPGSNFIEGTAKTALSEGVQESVTEAVNLGYDAGVLKEEMTIEEALEAMAYSGLVGAGVGAAFGAATTPLRGDAIPPEALPEENLDRMVARTQGLDAAQPEADALESAMQTTQQQSAQASVVQARQRRAQQDLEPMPDYLEQIRTKTTGYPGEVQGLSTVEDTLAEADVGLSALDEELGKVDSFFASLQEPEIENGEQISEPTLQDRIDALKEEAKEKKAYGSNLNSESESFKTVENLLGIAGIEAIDGNDSDAIAAVDAAIELDRLDIAEVLVGKAERKANTMSTEVGVDENHPKYSSIKKVLEDNKRKALEGSVSLRKRLEGKKKQIAEKKEPDVSVSERREKLYEGLDRQRVVGGIGEVQQRLSRPTTPDVAELIRRAPEETGPTPGELEFRRLNDREFLEEQKDKAIPPSLQKTETGKRLLNRGYRSALEGYKELTDKTKTSTKLNPSVDTISEAAAKLGGLDRKQAGSEGFDEASFKRNKLFPATGGRSFDEMAEVLNEQGYTNRENERLSANDVVDLVGGEVDQGESHYSNQVLAEMLTEDAAAVKEWSRELGGPERLNTAITKALAGEKLGAKQTQVVDEILTTVEAIRAEEVPGAVETLTARREERRAKEVETFNELVQEETGTEQAVADFDQYSEVMAELPEDADVYDAAFVSVATQASEKNFEATDSVLERLESGEINTDQALTELNQINEVTVDEQTTQEPEAERPETIEPVDTKPVEEKPAEPTVEPERTAEEIKADTLRLKSTPEGMEEFVTPWGSLTDAEKELWKTSAKTQKVIEPKQEKAEEIQEPTPEVEPETTEAVITEEVEEPEVDGWEYYPLPKGMSEPTSITLASSFLDDFNDRGDGYEYDYEQIGPYNYSFSRRKLSEEDAAAASDKAAIKKAGSYKFNFGKWRGATLKKVMEKAPKYIEWVEGNKGFQKSRPDLLEAIKTLKGQQDVPSTVRDLEPDPTANQPIDTLDQSLSAEQERGRAREVSEQVTEDLENSRAKQQDPSGISIDSPLDVGTESDQGVVEQDGQRVDEIGVTGNNDSRGNTEPSDGRLPTEPNGIEKVLEEAKQRQQNTRSDQQLEADKVDVVLSDAQNITDTLPLLSAEQVSDVINAERRLYEQGKKGMLFTNGTGTGKTYTGAGIIKRAVRMGKKVLVVAPNGTISGWQGAAKDLGFSLSKLPNKSTGAGDNPATITTFQNFADNQEIMQEHFDLVVYDESHKLMANMQGSDTKATAAHFALTNREGKSRGAMAYAKEFAKLRDDIRKHAKDNDVSEAEATQLPKFQRRRNALLKKSDAVDRKAQKAEKKSPTKAVFLSATPFSGHKSVFYGDGYIFESDEGYKDKGGYNSGNPQQQFLVKNFGYRMKYNKANTPSADIDVGLLERDWADQMFDSGSMVGRVLNLAHDYSREFVVVEPGVGSKVDELYEVVNYKDYPELSNVLIQWRKNGMDRQLAEALRIRGSLERIQKHLDIGRKVVVFHQRMNIAITQPLPSSSSDPKIGPELTKLKKARPDLFNIDFSGLHAAPDQILGEFGGKRVALFNGENTKERNKELKEFNTDGGNKDILVISKDAGKEGLSAHDISAVNQRALIITNTPQSPADAIQMEGRIYRFGLASNAVIEYPSVQTSFEKIAFRDVVSRRTATAENLAMGSQARLLRESFREGYMEPRATLPDHTQGTGGKDADRNTNEVTEFDRAKTYYWKRAQKTQATKAEEGADYFATPEPVGLSMVNLSGLVAGEKAMEPSAGHGAIGRWLPETTTNVFVEQSPQLIGELALVSEGEVKNMDFEDLNVINKFDVVVMNPPFGRGGATAIQHIDKATKHLNDGGRVVAIYPEGPAADKAFDKWYEGVEGIYQVGEIKLPDVTFSRAGTKVMTRIVMLDKDVKGGNVYKGEMKRDYSKVTDANELFERMEQLESIPRPDVSISASEVGLSLGEENGKYIATLSEFQTSGPARRIGKRELKKLADKYFGEVQTDTRSYWDENKYVFDNQKERNSFLKAILEEAQPKKSQLAKLDTKPAKGIPAADVQKEIDSFVKEYKGVSPVTIAIADKQENLPVNLKEGEKVKALYNPGDVSLVMVAENFNSAKEVRETLQHELVVHYGLRALMGRDRYNMHMDRLIRSKDKKLVAVMNEIKSDYAGYIDADSKSGQRIIAEEAIAKISETDLQVGALRRFTNALLGALKKIGLIADTATYVDAVNLIKSNARGLKGRVIQKGEVRTEEVETTFDQTPYLASLYNEQTIDNAPVSESLKEQMKAVHYTGDNRSIATRIKDALTFDMTAARQGLLDQFESIKSYEIEKFGKVLSAEDSAYKQATLSTDTNAIVETALKHGIPQYNDGEVSIRDDVKPLQAVFDQVTSLGDDFLPVWTHWLAAKRVKDLRLIEQGKEQLFTQDMVNEIFAEVDSKPEVKAVFEQAQRDYAAFNKATLDFAQNAGLIDPSQREMWEHDSYVPFYRMAEDAKKSGTFGKRGIEGQTAGIRQLKGGTDKLNIIESMVQNPMHLISASFKNIAMQKVVELTEGMAMDKVPMNWKPIDIDNRQIAKAMEELGIDFEALTTEQKEQYSTFFKMNAPQGENIVSVMVEGKREFYDVTDPLLLDSITALGPQPVNELVKLIGIPKRLLTNMVTSTPPFMIRNFIRDTMSNYVQADKVTGTTTQDTLLDATLMRPFGRAIKGMKASIANDQDRFKIMALGGMSGEYFGSTTEDVAGTLIKPSKSGMKKAATNLFDGYKHVIRASEEANRIAVYRQVKENGGSDFEAAYQAKNVLNFSRSGQYKVVQFLIGTVPFLNARVQGLDRLYQGAKSSPASFVLRGTLLTAATFALMAMNDDREEYWALNEHERDTYWHAWVDGVHIRIPKPFEVGAIFGTIPERVYEAATREEKVFLDRMGNMFMNTFSMNPVPQAFSPIVEQVANRSFFMDRPIVSMSLENLQPEMQFTNRTSEVAKMFANVMPDFMPDWARSPVRIEHLLNSYFGTVGGYVLGAGDNIAKTMGDTPIMPAKRVTDYPLVRDFIREGERSTKYVGRFYDMVNEASKLNRSVKDLEAQGRTDEAREMKAEYGSILQVRRRLNRARKRLTDINASIKRIYINRTMSAEAKRKKLDQLTKKKNDITKEISDKYWKLF